MPVFSASIGRRASKTYYKDYKRINAADMARVAQLSRTCSLSSYVYGEGDTDTVPVEHCQGHRAGKSVVGSGDIGFFDFDDSGLTEAALTEKVQDCAAFITPSKGWSEAVGKYHVGVQIDRLFPVDKDEFVTWYRAIAQWLGFEGFYDPCMEVWVQQIAPSMRDDGPNVVFEGAPLDMDAVLAAYIEPEQTRGDSSGAGIAGVVDDDAVFKHSVRLDEFTVEEMRELALAEGKQRVHCLKGIRHDDRADTAFVSASDGAVIYHCTGGRCGETLLLPPATGFVDEPEEAVTATPAAAPVSLEDWIARSRELISHNPELVSVYTAEGKDPDRECAVAWACGVILSKVGVRVVEGAFRLFDGRLWVEVFKTKSERLRFVSKVAQAAGFFFIANSPTKLPRMVSLLMDQVPTLEGSNDFDALNLQNGVYVQGRGLCKHDPRFVFTSILPYAYEPSASCPHWEALVSRIMLESVELMRALQDAMGYLMLSRFNMEKMVCFVGEGSNGKSTVNKVLKGLVGDSGYSAQRLHLLTKSGGEGAYARAMLQGKLINITNELSPSAMEAEMFKDIISGDDIDARWPYGKPFTLVRVPKQLASTNVTDRLIKERTDGFTRRLHLIPFNYRVPDDEKDYELDAKLAAELPGILNWVMVGAARVLANNCLTQAPEMTSLLEQVQRDGSSVQQWREQWIDTTEVPERKQDWPAAVEPVMKLYESYVEFSVANGLKPLGSVKFSRELEHLKVTKVYKVVKIDKHPVKVSGFFARILRPGERRDPGEYHEKPQLTVVDTKTEG